MSRRAPGLQATASRRQPPAHSRQPSQHLPALCSAHASQVDPPVATYGAAWQHRTSHGDLLIIAADGTSEPAHRVVLQCRVPLLHNQPLGPTVQQMRVGAVADHATLLAWLEFVYTDDVAPAAVSHPLYLAALRCHMERLATICEAHFTGAGRCS